MSGSLFVDQWESTLASTLAVGGGTISVPIPDAVKIPNADNARGYHLTLDDGAGSIEVVFCYATNEGTGALSVWRGIFGTTAQEWVSGSRVYLRVPAGVLSYALCHLPYEFERHAFGGARTLHPQDYAVSQIYLTANITSLAPQSLLVDSDTPGAFIHDIVVTQDGTGGYTVAWSTNVKWPGGTAPVISTAADATDIFRLYRMVPDMTYWAGVILGQNIPT